MSQFEPRWDPLVLLQVVPRVLRTADPEHPELVSQRAYDAARADAGYPHSPRADKLAAKFNVPWSRLTAAVISEREPVRALSRSDYSRAQRWRSETEIVSAIKTAAAWLGTDHINPESYERARSAINASTQRRHLHGRSFVPLPSAMVLSHRMPFAEAVAAAGLRITPRQSAPPISPNEIVRLFVEQCGFTPREADVVRFARQHDIRLAAHLRRPRHAAVVFEVKAEFERLGRWFPHVGRNAVPDDWLARVEAESDALRLASERYPSKREGTYTLSELRGSVRDALDLLQPGQQLTYAAYKRLRAQHPHLVHMTQVQQVAKRHGLTWAALVREVTAERAEAARQTAPDEQ